MLCLIFIVLFSCIIDGSNATLFPTTASSESVVTGSTAIFGCNSSRETIISWYFRSPTATAATQILNGPTGNLRVVSHFASNSGRVAQQSDLTITSVQQSNAGSYKCETVVNGHRLSQEFTLHVLDSSIVTVRSTTAADVLPAVTRLRPGFIYYTRWWGSHRNYITVTPSGSSVYTRWWRRTINYNTVTPSGFMGYSRWWESHRNFNTMTIPDFMGFTRWSKNQENYKTMSPSDSVYKSSGYTSTTRTYRRPAIFTILTVFVILVAGVVKICARKKRSDTPAYQPPANAVTNV